MSAVIFSGAMAASQAAFADDDERLYEVTIRNATHGQPIAPSLLVTHAAEFSLFEIGMADIMDLQYFGLAKMAETGNPGDLATTVAGADGVNDVEVLPFPVGDPPIMPPGESNSTTVSASGDAKYFSAAGMLAATNDAFYAVRGIALPKGTGQSVTVYANAYDAGSEDNNEEDGKIPATPLGNTDDVDDGDIGDGGEGYIHVHAGIHGIADLVPEVYDWRNPVIEITITRIEDE